jgi:hypothetical protein
MLRQLKLFFVPEKRVLYFTIAWLVINLLQACFTGLANDEAYYWMYARRLDIGYFDHPPMIAVMIKAGYFLFNNELGLRLFVVLFSTLTIPVLYSLAGRKDFNLLALLFASMTVFEVYGFIAVPDAPLMFFTALFFLAYRKYLHYDGLAECALLTIIIVLLLYSKYHGFLILFFTLLSNLSLFRRRSFYYVIAGAVLLYLPHIWWQIANDYPSYQYHVLNKSQDAYHVFDSVNFLAGVLLVAGPLTGGFLVYAAIRSRREKTPVTRTMSFTFFGFVIFFFASTFNAAVEANWMAAAMVPLLIIGHRYISARSAMRKWTLRFAIASVAIFAFARVNLVTDLVPAAGSKAMPEFYGWREWAQTVKAHAKGRPVVIMNSYQKASKYSFYENTDALSLNNVAYRRNQFDIWNIVDSMQGKNIALVTNWWGDSDTIETFETPRGKMQLLNIDNFHSYTKVSIRTDNDWYHFPPGQEVMIPLTFHVPGKPIDFTESDQPESLVCTRYFFNTYDEEIKILNLDSIRIHDNWQTVIRIKTPEKKGPYYLRFSIRSGPLPPYLNSRLIRMDVE